MPFRHINVFNFSNALDQIDTEYVSVDQLKSVLNDEIWQAHLNNQNSILIRMFKKLSVGVDKNVVEKEAILSLGLLLCSGSEDDRISILFNNICEEDSTELTRS